MDEKKNTAEHDTTQTDRLVVDIKQMRVQIDACIRGEQRLAERIARGDAGREVALSITKLQEAKMWLGQALGAIGFFLPNEYRDFSE